MTTNAPTTPTEYLDLCDEFLTSLERTVELAERIGWDRDRRELAADTLILTGWPLQPLEPVLWTLLADIGAIGGCGASWDRTDANITNARATLGFCRQQHDAEYVATFGGDDA